MLKLRICSACGATTRSQNSYFCHSCGARLKTPPAPPSPKGSATVPVQAAAVGVRAPFYFWLLFFLSALLLSLAAGFISWRYFLRQKVELITPSPVSVSANIVTKTTPFPLVDKEFASVVPEHTYFYLRGYDLPEVLIWLGGEDLKQQVYSLTGFSLEEIASYLELDFSLLEHPLGWGLLAKVKEEPFLKETMEKVVWKGEPLAYFRLENGYFIAAQSLLLLEEWERVFKKTSRSLALNAQFSQAFRTLPVDEEGIFWLYWTGERLNFFAKMDGLAKITPGVWYGHSDSQNKLWLKSVFSL